MHYEFFTTYLGPKDVYQATILTPDILIFAMQGSLKLTTVHINKKQLEI